MDLTEQCNAEWMAHVAKTNRHIHLAVAEGIVKVIKPMSVLDVGCGPCGVANRLHELGVPVVAIDGSRASEACATPGVTWQHWEAGQGPYCCQDRVDVVASTEFLEHVRPEWEPYAVDTIAVNCLRVAVITASDDPGRNPETNHVNAQPKDYWLKRFEPLGLVRDLALEKRLADTWPPCHYTQYLMVLVRE